MKPPKRLESTQRWAQVALGRFDAETQSWLSAVALKVLEANGQQDENARRTGLVRALGLSGRMNTDPLVLSAFFGGLGITDWSTVRGSEKTKLRNLAAQLIGEAEISDEAMDKRIREALAEGK